jgi:hypothetical protein
VHRPLGSAPPSTNTEHHLTVRRSQRLNPELHTQEFIDALNAETERQRLERQERHQKKREKRLEKEDSSQSTEASDTESVISTNPGKAHKEARDQFDTYLANLKDDLRRLEETPKSEKENRLEILHSILDNYDDLASIGNILNDDRQAQFEPRIEKFQQDLDTAESADARTAAEKNLSLWKEIVQQGLCAIEKSINDQVDKAYTEYNQFVAEPTTPPRTTIPDTSQEETPTFPGQFKQETHSSDDDSDDLPPSPTPKPKEKQPELTTTAETTPAMTEQFKVPKPRIYTGDNGHREASAIDAWIQKLKDYLKLSGIQDNENKVLVMQYFLGGTAEEFYHTKRLANKTTTIDYD